MTIELLNCDCMEYMKTQPDNAFDLAIVDPQYGIGFDGKTTTDKHGWQKYEQKKWDRAIPKRRAMGKAYPGTRKL